MSDIAIGASPAERIRDLGNEEFQERYGGDRLTATVLSSRFRYTVQHMCSGVLQQSFSSILRDWYDFAAAVSGPAALGYPMPAVSNSLMLFLGTMALATRNTVEEYGPSRLRPGDVLIGNDPYRIGTHVNDVCFIRPVFAGRDEPVCYLNVKAHLIDMGGVIPAGFSGTKRNVFENGLVMSPRLLYHGDEAVLETWNLLFDNTRFPEILISDISALHQALALGERLLTDSVERYGLDAFHGAMRYACDLSAEAMGAALRRLPDGVYEGEDILDCDALDDSEEYRVRVSISVRDGRAEIDFSGTSRQARTSVNAGWLDTKSGVAIALMFLLAPNSSFTSGTLRDVDILLPEGTFVSARPPEGVIFLFFEAVPVILSAIFRALAPALGERAVGGDFGTISLHSANGTHPDGRPWVTMAQLGGEHGPWAATAAGDGDSYTVYYAANNMDPPTEAIEADVPAVVLRKEYATDTGGPGRHRGGASVLHDTLYLEEAEHFSMPLRFKTPSGFGVHGGGAGGGGGVWMWSGRDAVEAARNAPGLEPAAYADSTPVAGRLDPERLTTSPDGTFFSFARVPVWNTTAGALFRYLTNGGGGWGDPLEREPADVLRDVRDEYVSLEGAERDYGVVVHGDAHHDPEGLVLDEAATARARERLRAGRAAPGHGVSP